MKYLAVITILLIVGCKEKYPKIVHNKCTGKWAILTGYGWRYQDSSFPGYLEDMKDENLYYRTYKINNLRTYKWYMDTAEHYDTIVNAGIGFESTFDDSVSAAHEYFGWIKRKAVHDSLSEIENKKRALVTAIQKKIDDSINKCRNTYE